MAAKDLIGSSAKINANNFQFFCSSCLSGGLGYMFFVGQCFGREIVYEVGVFRLSLYIVIRIGRLCLVC